MRCNRPAHIGERELSAWQFDARGRCRACLNRSSWRVVCRKRGVALDPPAGYVPIRVAAARAGLTMRALNRRVRMGAYAGKVWQRCARGKYYVWEGTG